MKIVMFKQSGYNRGIYEGKKMCRTEMIYKPVEEFRTIKGYKGKPMLTATCTDCLNKKRREKRALNRPQKPHLIPKIKIVERYCEEQGIVFRNNKILEQVELFAIWVVCDKIVVE